MDAGWTICSMIDGRWCEEPGPVLVQLYLCAKFAPSYSCRVGWLHRAHTPGQADVTYGPSSLEELRISEGKRKARVYSITSLLVVLGAQGFGSSPVASQRLGVPPLQTGACLTAVGVPVRGPGPANLTGPGLQSYRSNIGLDADAKTSL